MKFKNIQDIEYTIYFGKPRIKGKNVDGLCDNPKLQKPQIILDCDLKNRRKLNVLIEEVFHAHFFDMTEKNARKFSANLGKIIYSMFLKNKKKNR